MKEGQKSIPDFLNNIISKCGNCYSMLSYANKEFPLFNGATEINYKDYDIFLKTLKYKFINKNHEIADLIKIRKNYKHLFRQIWISKIKESGRSFYLYQIFNFN